MDFEYDPVKSAANLRKHGISFEDARRLWLDENRVVVGARSETEPREAIIARLSGTHWTAIYTVRGASIRIVSVRRSRDEERQGYNKR